MAKEHKKKKQTWLFLLIAFIVVLIGYLFISADNNNNDDVVSAGDVDTSDFPQWLLDIYNDPPKDTYVPTLFDVLDLAYENGTITEEQYYLLSVNAWFTGKGGKGLTGPMPDEYDPTTLLGLISDNIENLSSDAQKILRPLILPPQEKDSFWNDDNKFDDYMKKLEIIPSVTAVINKRGGVAGYLIEHPGEQYRAKIDAIGDELTKAYQKYIDAGYPQFQEWFFVKLVPSIPSSGNTIIRGSAELAKIEGKRRCWITIGLNADEKHLRSTAAHELFHCMQYNMGLKINQKEKWFRESTAVWAQEFARPDFNIEHERDTKMFSSFDKAFFDKSDLRHYASYLWWFYLYQKEGKTGQEVKKMITDVKTKGMKGAISGRPNYADELKEYALWNWNQDWFKYYVDTDGLPSNIPSGSSIKTHTAYNQKEETVAVDMLAGSIQYQFFFIENDIKKIEFDLAKVNQNIFEKNSVHMIYLVGGKWYYQDVSKEDKVKFCRTRAHDLVDVVVFIVSDADLDTDLQLGEIKYDARGECNPEWSGVVKYSWTYTHSEDLSLLTLSGDPGQSNYRERGFLLSRDTLVYDDDDDEFVIKEQHVTYSYDESQTFSYQRECGLQFESSVDQVKGSSMKKWGVDKDDPSRSSSPTRMWASADDPLEYDVDVDIIGDLNSIRSDSRKVSVRKPCGLEGISTPVPPSYSSDTFTSKGVSPRGPLNQISAKLSEDGKSITYNGQGYFNYGDTKVPVDVEVDYRYG